MTPTNASLGELDPATLSKLDGQGRLVSGNKETKESSLHLAVYDVRASAGAIVHLHSTHSVAVSCLADVDPADVPSPDHRLLRDENRYVAADPLFSPG